MADFYALTRFFTEYNAYFKEFLDFEYKKLRLLNEGEIKAIAELLPREQAYIMQTNAYEAKRLNLLGDDKTLTFDQLIDKAPASCKQRLEQQHEELSNLVLKIKDINDTINVVINGRLKHIEKKSSVPGTYDDKGSVKAPEHSAAPSVSKNI